MMTKYTNIVIFFLLSFLSACCCRNVPDQLPPPAAETATIKLAEAADSINKSLITLAKYEQTDFPCCALHCFPNNACLNNMPRSVSIDWSGPIEPLLLKIAYASCYKFRVLGVKPAIPVMITISAHDTPMADILRDTAFQALTKAQVMVYPQERIIELRYAKP